MVLAGTRRTRENGFPPLGVGGSRRRRRPAFGPPMRARQCYVASSRAIPSSSPIIGHHKTKTNVVTTSTLFCTAYAAHDRAVGTDGDRAEDRTNARSTRSETKDAERSGEEHTEGCGARCRH